MIPRNSQIGSFTEKLHQFDSHQNYELTILFSYKVAKKLADVLVKSILSG